MEPVLRALGPMELRRGEAKLPLPQSKKTRALLAYLALEPRQHRRERLISLFWDVTDDPRGALRWSLSKVRRTLGEDAHLLEATRQLVQLRLSHDLEPLMQAATQGVAQVTSERLLELLGPGELLQGLTLPDFQDFEAWLRARRSQAEHWQAIVAEELAGRPLEQAQALWVARRWRQLQPDSGRARKYLQCCQAEQHPAPPMTTSVPQAATPAISLRGRDRELAWLQQACTQVEHQQRGHLALVEAPPGYGKTALLDAFARAHPSSTSLLRACGYEAHRGRPLGLFADVALLAGAELEVGHNASTERSARELSLLHQIAQQAHAGQVLLMVDDGHLIDPSSAAVLGSAARMDLPILIVVAIRPGEVDTGELRTTLDELNHLGRLSRLQLAPLDSETIRALLPPGLAQEQQARIVEQSRGLPLYALQLSRGTTAAPSGLDELASSVRLRLQRLGADTCKLLKWAAILRRGSWEELRQVAALPERAGARSFGTLLDETERFDLLTLDRQAQTFDWSHALVQSAVHATIPAGDRPAMYGAVAQVLNGLEEDPTRVAFFAEHSGNAQLAAQLSLAAAQRSFASGGTVEARNHAQQARAAAASLAPRQRIEIDIAATILLWQAGALAGKTALDALSDLGMSALELKRHNAARDAFYYVGWKRWESGAKEVRTSSRRSYVAGSMAGQEQQSSTPAQAALCLLLLEQRFPEAEALVQEAESLTRTTGELPAELPLAKGLLAQHRGEWLQAWDCYEDSRLMARASSDLLLESHVLELQARWAYARRELDACHAAVEALATVAPRIRESGELPLARGLLAIARGDDQTCQEVTGELERLDDKRRLAFYSLRWACQLWRTGQGAGLRETLAQRARTLAREMGSSSDWAMAVALALAAATHRGDEVLYATLEEELAQLESDAVLSHEAQQWIRQLINQ